jgi:hypothetical protein
MEPTTRRDRRVGSDALPADRHLLAESTPKVGDVFPAGPVGVGVAGMLAGPRWECRARFRTPRPATLLLLPGGAAETGHRSAGGRAPAATAVGVTRAGGWAVAPPVRLEAGRLAADLLAVIRDGRAGR